ncbi:MAG TPA: uroporphyrinogen decarboxylase family protein [Sumerlaeia bacterium]|nr:uroporphyrinogen decarboxylase family protein [Sumerlaeia bacterium]
MSYEDGWAAVNLRMPKRVPRFEPSAAEYHWDLVKAVTGIDVSVDSPHEERFRAQQAFVRAWNYDIYFGCAVGHNVLGEKLTHMGHAEYAQKGRDFDANVSCPFRSPEEVLAFDPWETFAERDFDARLRLFNDQYRAQCEAFPTALNTTGIYTTLMSAMIAIFGWDMLLSAAAISPDGFGEVVNRFASWIQQYYDACAHCDADVIYSHDDMVWTQGPFIHPDWYRKYIFPNLEKLWAPLRAAGKKIMFVCDGNYTPFLDDVAACGNHGFWFEIFTDLEAVARKFGQTHFIIGNVDCRVLTFGSKADIRAEVERCMALGKPCPGYFLCVSGHIPPNVPVENALYYNEVYEELSVR